MERSKYNNKKMNNMDPSSVLKKSINVQVCFVIFSPILSVVLNFSATENLCTSSSYSSSSMDLLEVLQSHRCSEL